MGQHRLLFTVIIRDYSRHMAYGTETMSYVIIGHPMSGMGDELLRSGETRSDGKSRDID